MYLADFKKDQLLRKELSIQRFRPKAEMYEEWHGEIVRGRKCMWGVQMLQGSQLFPLMECGAFFWRNAFKKPEAPSSGVETMGPFEEI